MKKNLFKGIYTIIKPSSVYHDQDIERNTMEYNGVQNFNFKKQILVGKRFTSPNLGEECIAGFMISHLCLSTGQKLEVILDPSLFIK